MVKALLFCLTLPCALLAQLPGEEFDLRPAHDYTIQQYNSENGLPQNSARDLLLDKNGFLWVATENGLARFDGQRFRLYNTSNSPVLKMNRFAVLSENSRREVLIRSEFDPSVIFKVMPDYSIVIDSPSTRLPHKLISFHSNGIFDETPIWNHLASDSTLRNVLQSATSFWILNEKEVVIRYNYDWYYLGAEPRRFIHLPVEPEQDEVQYAFFSRDIFCILRKNSRLVFFRKGQPITIRMDSTMSALLQEAAVSSAKKFAVYTKGGLAIAKIDNDIYRLDIEQDTLKAKLLFRDLRFLENQPFYSFQYDSSSGKLFVGTQNEGLFVLSPRQFHVLTFPVKDFFSNIFMANLPFSGNRLLTSNGIFYRGDPRRDSLFPVSGRPDRHCFYKGADGRLWVSRNKLLIIYDSTFTRPIWSSHFPLDSYITDILQASDGSMWISTISSLWKWEKDSLRCVIDHYPAFVRHNIETMAEVDRGTLWLGTWDGIYLLHTATEKIEAKPLLEHVYTRSIYLAKDKSVWIGTYGNGYFRYSQGRFVSLPRDSRNYLATVHAFMEDANGRFWMSTNHGLFRVHKQGLDNYAAGGKDPVFFEYFDKTLGFNTNEFNGGCRPAATAGADGNFYFPSLDGMVYFDPQSIVDQSPGGTLLIDDLSVDSMSVDHHLPIRIPPDFNRIVAEVAIPYYGLDDNLHLEYTIDAAGGKWYPVSKDGKIIINRLPYGTYALLFRAPGNKVDLPIAGISFEVLPHWYNTPWFYLILSLAFVGIISLLLLLRTRILRDQNFRLQAKVEERTAELEHSTLLKEKLISVIIHDLRSPLFSMSLLIDHMAHNHDRIPATDFNENLFVLNEACRGICRFSTDFLTWYNSQKDGFSIRNELIKIEEFIRDTGVLYKDIMVRKNIVFNTEIPPGLTMVSDKNILAVIIRNLMDNAVKYTIQGNILVRVEKTDIGILVQVADTGAGMSAEKVSRLLDAQQKNSVDSSSSFGYRFITELVHRLESSLTIDSTLGKGTTVSILHPFLAQ